MTRNVKAYLNARFRFAEISRSSIECRKDTSLSLVSSGGKIYRVINGHRCPVSPISTARSAKIGSCPRSDNSQLSHGDPQQGDHCRVTGMSTVYSGHGNRCLIRTKPEQRTRSPKRAALQSSSIRVLSIDSRCLFVVAA